MATRDEPEVCDVPDAPGQSAVRARDIGAVRTRRLEPVHRPGLLGYLRPRFGRPVLWLGWAVAAVLGLMLIDRPSGLDCKVAYATRTTAVALGVCRREYAEAHGPAIGILLANLLRKDKQPGEARALAVALIETPERANAFQILAKIATDARRHEEANVALAAARLFHLAEHRLGDAARDDQARARIFNEQDRYSDALLALDECLGLARDAADSPIELYCRLAASRVLSLVGDFAGAQDQLDRGERLATSDADRAWLAYQQGNLEQDYERVPGGTGHDLRAIAAFEKVLELNARAQIPDLVVSTELNLAYSLAEAHQIPEAERHLALAKTLDVDGGEEMTRTQVEARIAFRKGDLVRAAAINDKVYSTIDVDDDRVEVAAMQAQIALAGNDLPGAEIWARRGIADVEKIGHAEPMQQLRSYVLSTRRKPYELLFVTLVRAGRSEDAVTVLAEWQGRTMVDALAAPAPTTSNGLRGAAERVANLGKWLPAASSASPGGSADRGRVLGALGAVDLLALVLADQQVWRVTALHGRIAIANLGRLIELQDGFDRFRSAPTDPALAASLGELLVADDAFRATSPLHVLLDGPLSALPVEALRRHGRPLVALRPVMRVLRLPAASCGAAPVPGRATVIADARSDLPAARQEADDPIRRFAGRVTTAFGADATSEVLFAATLDDLLHIGVHAGVKAGGGVLELHDRDVPALEITARKLGASLVVLSACSSASANDVGLGSLATAFLAAGSPRVIATLHKVPDAGASRLITRFYRAGGVTDPVRMLAKIQSQLADEGDTDWPSFVVFGHEVCTQP